MCESVSSSNTDKLALGFGGGEGGGGECGCSRRYLVDCGDGRCSMRLVLSLIGKGVCRRHGEASVEIYLGMFCTCRRP